MTRKTFIFAFLLMALVLAISLAVLYFAMPWYYLFTKEHALQQGMDLLAADLAECGDGDAGIDKVTNFTAEYNADVLAFDGEGRLLPTLSSPFISIASLPDTNIRYNEEPGSDADTYSLFITSEQYEQDGDAAITRDKGIQIIIENEQTDSDASAESFMISSSIENAVITTQRAVASETVGHITATSTLQPIDEAQGVILSLLPWLLLVSALLALGLSWIFSRQLTKPILQISGAAVRMQQMQPDAESGVRTGDELEELSRNLDAMYHGLCDTIHSLRDETERAGRLERSKTEFMQSAGHELKTPIAALGGIVEGMIDNVGIYRDRDTYLAECKNQIDALAGLVGKILQASKADLPDEELLCEEIHLQSLIEQVAETQALFVREKNLQVQLTGLDVTIHSDVPLLTQVFRNLVSNAVRYTEPGAYVRITGLRTEAGLQVEVCNTCGPIAPEELQKLVLPFYTRSYSRDKTQSGTGLGLYIVKKNLDRLDIPFEIESAGGEFRFGMLFPAEDA